MHALPTLFPYQEDIDKTVSALLGTLARVALGEFRSARASRKVPSSALHLRRALRYQSVKLNQFVDLLLTCQATSSPTPRSLATALHAQNFTHRHTTHFDRCCCLFEAKFVRGRLCWRKKQETSNAACQSQQADPRSALTTRQATIGSRNFFSSNIGDVLCIALASPFTSVQGLPIRIKASRQARPTARITFQFAFDLERRQ